MAKAPDVSAGQVIASSHINAINNSIYTWQDHIDANNKNLTNVAKFQVNATALPGSPTAGIITLDSGASNALKWHNGTAWKTVVSQEDPSVTITGTSPAIVIKNTTNKVSVVNHTWNDATQWVSGTGLPATSNVNYSIAEYTDGAYQGVRFMVFKGGNVAIGSTTDDATNKLQVTGNGIFTGNLRVTGNLQLDTGFSSLTVTGTAPVYVSKNSDANIRTAGMFLNWNNASQWFIGSGSPSNTNTNFSLTEYTDGVFQGVRLMVFKGGRMAIGSTADDTINTLQVAGPVKMTGVTMAYVEKSADYTLTAADYTVNCTAALTATLPTAVGITGRVYVVKNSSNGTVTVNTTSAQLIDGQPTVSLAQYESVTLQSTGAGWIII